MSTPLLGGHVSAAGGLDKAIDNAGKIGAECIQMFGSSPRGWAVRMPLPPVIEAFKRKQKESRVREVYLHGPYLVNLASPSDDARKKSLQTLAGHLKIVDLIGADGLIFHIGSGKELPKKDALTFAVEGIKEVLKRVPGKVQLVIENAAGGGQKIGATAADVGHMIKKIKSSRLKVCYDTAHAFEAGLIDEYTSAKTKELLDEWDAEVGMENIVALHVNDSKSPFDSHYDRHENIGKGFIGLKSFKVLAKEKRLQDKAWLLEVPGFDDMGPDKKNMDILRKCFKK